MEKEVKKNAFTHDNKNNKTDVWVTPQWIFETLNIDFDLDPATEPGGISWIPAKNTYSKADDGLSQDWKGRVWLNPPYGPNTPDWLQKMHKHRNGVALVFARTDTNWFQDFCLKADALCFLKGRIAFVDWYDRTKSQGAGAGSLLIAWGGASVEALKNFEKLTKNKGWFVDLRTPEIKNLQESILNADI